MNAAKRLKILAGVVVGGAVLISAGIFVYIHFIEADPPAKLTLNDATTTTATGGGTTSTVPFDGNIAGTWRVAPGSKVGYRIEETLFGQSNTAVGRGQGVEGTMTIAGTTVTAATFTVQVSSITSDRSQRDGQFNRRIMNTSQFPTATFVLGTPIDLGAKPADQQEIKLTAKGKLTLHGVTRDVTFDLTAKLNGGEVDVAGSTKVVFADYQIDNPSGGPASVGDDGELELLLLFTKAP